MAQDKSPDARLVNTWYFFVRSLLLFHISGTVVCSISDDDNCECNCSPVSWFFAISGEIWAFLANCLVGLDVVDKHSLPRCHVRRSFGPQEEFGLCEG